MEWQRDSVALWATILTNYCLQVVRYADLYAATFLNLIYYPFSYMFRAPAMLMPHESTVAHEQRFIMDAPMISRTRGQKQPLTSEQAVEEIPDVPKSALNVVDAQKEPAGEAGVPHTRPETPRSVTHNHDEDYSDEESDPNNKSGDDDPNKSFY